MYNFIPDVLKSKHIKTIIMKTTVNLAGILLVILLAFGGTINAQRGMRGNGMRSDSLRTREFRQDIGPGRMMPGGQFNGKRHMNGMRNGMGIGPGPMAGMGRGMGNINRNGWGPMASGRLINESLPNVTEKQKKDMADLQLKHQEEMKKLREETSVKMQSLRDAHNKAVLNILTDEQKKFIESKQSKPALTPALAK
jgi:hypothetical protein